MIKSRNRPYTMIVLIKHVRWDSGPSYHSGAFRAPNTKILNTMKASLNSQKSTRDNYLPADAHWEEMPIVQIAAFSFARP